MWSMSPPAMSAGTCRVIPLRREIRPCAATCMPSMRPREIWSGNDGLWPRSVPVSRGLSVAEGRVYVESYDLLRYRDRGALPGRPFHGQVSAFDARTGEIKWLLEIDDTFAEPPTVHQGVAYMASSKGVVCAVRAPS